LGRLDPARSGLPPLETITETNSDFSAAAMSAAEASVLRAAEEAARVTKDVAEKVAHRGEVSAEELSGLVIASLRKVNKKASEEFVKFRNNKLKAKKNVK